MMFWTSKNSDIACFSCLVKAANKDQPTSSKSNLIRWTLQVFTAG